MGDGNGWHTSVAGGKGHAMPSVAAVVVRVTAAAFQMKPDIATVCVLTSKSSFTSESVSAAAEPFEAPDGARRKSAALAASEISSFFGLYHVVVRVCTLK